MIYLLIPYALVGACVYWKFCWGRADVGLEERIWSILLWPLLVIAALIFIGLLAAHSKDLENNAKEHELPNK